MGPSEHERAREESEKERIDRELMELLQELRVAIPGVQVLFAFLLTIPFSQGFEKLTAMERSMYAVTLMLAALSTGLLIAPTSYHRLHFRSGEKKRLLFTSNRLAILGLGLLAAAITSSVLVVMVAVFTATWALVLAAATGAWLYWFWYGLPLLRKSRG